MLVNVAEITEINQRVEATVDLLLQFQHYYCFHIRY